MKILCLSDLHLYFVSDIDKYNTYKMYLQSILLKLTFDCIVISGDIFESSYNGNPYKELRNLFSFISKDIPIICCLGNHEFAHRSIIETLRFYSSIPKNSRYNVYYLDVDNYVELSDYNFIGNVFWYDNSLLSNPLGVPDKVVSNWLDSTIHNFIPSIENKKCKDQIFSNIKLGKKNILVTHTVTHKDLNRFNIIEPTSLYNQYSGCADFLQELKDKNVILSICGHTHKREMQTIYNIDCINVGNDYYRGAELSVLFYVVDI